MTGQNYNWIDQDENQIIDGNGNNLVFFKIDQALRLFCAITTAKAFNPSVGIVKAFNPSIGVTT